MMTFVSKVQSQSQIILGWYSLSPVGHLVYLYELKISTKSLVITKFKKFSCTRVFKVLLGRQRGKEPPGRTPPLLTENRGCATALLLRVIEFFGSRFTRSLFLEYPFK